MLCSFLLWHTLTIINNAIYLYRLLWLWLFVPTSWKIVLPSRNLVAPSWKIAWEVVLTLLEISAPPPWKIILPFGKIAHPSWPCNAGLVIKWLNSAYKACYTAIHDLYFWKCVGCYMLFDLSNHSVTALYLCLDLAQTVTDLDVHMTCSLILSILRTNGFTEDLLNN